MKYIGILSQGYGIYCSDIKYIGNVNIITEKEKIFLNHPTILSGEKGGVIYVEGSNLFLPHLTFNSHFEELVKMKTPIPYTETSLKLLRLCL